MTLTTIIMLNAILDAVVVVGLLALVARCVRPDYGRSEVRVQALPRTHAERVAA